MEQELKELTKAVYEIDKKMAIFIQRHEDYTISNSTEHRSICSTQNDMNIILREHNGRLKKLEKWKYGIMGGLGVILFLLGWMWDYIKTVIK